MVRRLFVGTFLTSLQQELFASLKASDNELSLSWKRKLRWVKAEKLHLTWFFIGDGDEQEIATHLSGIAGKHQGFNLEFDCVQLWPNPYHSRQLVLTATKTSPEAQELASDIKEACFSKPSDNRPFQPHVTLLRLEPGKSAQLIIPEWLPFKKLLPLKMNINNFALVESNLTQGQYQIKTQYLLSGNA